MNICLWEKELSFLRNKQELKCMLELITNNASQNEGFFSIEWDSTFLQLEEGDCVFLQPLHSIVECKHKTSNNMTFQKVNQMFNILGLAMPKCFNRLNTT